MSWKIDSKNITDFYATRGTLEAMIIFWILAAGKTAKGAERILSVLLPNDRKLPFEQLHRFSQKNLSEKLQLLGCGCFNSKGRSLYEIIHSNLDLRDCSISELESIYGIGRKTSRCFILHSRKNAKCSGLDTHILKFLKSKGVNDVPKSTPSSKKQYDRLENIFLHFCKRERKSPARFDLEIWKSYSIKDKIN